MGALYADAALILEEIYPQSEIDDLTMRDRPFLKLVPKADDFVGDTMRIALTIGQADTFSSDPAVALASANPAGTMANAWAAFTGSRYRAFNSCSLDREAVHASSRNKGALANLLEVAVDGMLDRMGAGLATWCYGDGTSAYGVYSSASGEVWTLTRPDDAKNFRVGSNYQVYNGTGPSVRTITAAAGFSALGAGTAIKVAAVDEDAGTVTFTAGDTAAVGSLTAGDTLLPAGAANYGGAFPGLAAWIPLTAPTSTAFFGQNRAIDISRLSGVRVNKPTQRITTSIRQVSERIRVVADNRSPSHVFMNPVNFTAMVEQEASKQITMQSSFDSGFETIRVMTSGGAVKVFPDPDCPTNLGYVISMDSWKIHHLNGLPQLMKNKDGHYFRDIDATNSYKIFGEGYAWLACDAPGRNGCFAIG
jgi:hypothetical protein